MSMRTLEEEKELDELTGIIFFDETEEEKTQREARIAELEKKEKNLEYELIKYDINHLSLKELQVKYMELSDEYDALESELEDIKKEYEESYIDEEEVLEEEIGDLENGTIAVDDSNLIIPDNTDTTLSTDIKVILIIITVVVLYNIIVIVCGKIRGNKNGK